MSKVLKTLEDRGLLKDTTDREGLEAALSNESVVFYCGFDPTGESLHLGHLTPLIIARHLQNDGHKPILVVGGATGSIGDPSGKSMERKLLDAFETLDNLKKISRQLDKLVSFVGQNKAEIKNNSEWISPFSFIDWLREVGKFFTVNYMMGKDSVKDRLENRDQGISFTEFSYMLVQAYDFYHLYKNENCTLQIGGSDQWGNITAGLDLIHKKAGGKAFGLTCPLVTTSSGKKFGKSEGNAVWLDPKMTSPFEFYQYWMRIDDSDVSRFLKMFTFLPLHAIESICFDHFNAPHKKIAQKILADQVTKFVHGQEGLDIAKSATEILYNNKEIENLTEDQISQIFSHVESSEIDKELISAVDLFATAICGSKGKARKLIKSGGAYINNKRVENIDFVIDKSQCIGANSLIIRSGKKNYHVVKFI